MKDSSAACATLGMNLTFTKVAVFALASAMAGVGGAMFGGLRGQVGPDDFQMLNSLVLLLLVSIAGINTVTGAFMGGMTFGMFPKFLEWMPKSWPRNLPQLGVGLGAFGLRQNPNGWTSDPGMAPIGALVRRVLRVDRPGDDVIDLRPGDVPAAAQEEVRQLAGTAS
jgi:branched-chain amino acid transport system permease protein